MISMKSKIAKELLNYFFLNPEESLFVNEIERKLDLDKRNLVKKLRELEETGILKSETRGNQKIYSINKGYPLYDEYRKIVFKTIGIESKLKSMISKIKGIEKVYLFGSYAKDSMEAHSDVDLLVIGDHSIMDLQKKISVIQKEIGREINVVNMDMRDFEKRKMNKDPFIETVFKEKNIEVL
ncbi:MAG: nucleotidyltransferase domain-containing protein [Candidatus Omnitrophica bacterium]|nr:nucleotidyltransferase domain-containing protein [Candidatus Omnitrophota bacterium]